MQKLTQAVQKTRNGCFKTATQLLTGFGKAPIHDETVAKVWDPCCGEAHAADGSA